MSNYQRVTLAKLLERSYCFLFGDDDKGSHRLSNGIDRNRPGHAHDESYARDKRHTPGEGAPRDLQVRVVLIGSA